MKFMFVSDIHGSLYWLKRAVEKYEEEQADYWVLLGDYLYHGPRNPLPEGYDPAGVAELLNQQSPHIAAAIRGNCDAEVDQMLLQFPMMADYAVLFYEGRRIYVTHGHGHSMENLPPLQSGDLFLQGHTHIPVARSEGDVYLCNPGSISLPKGNYPHSYGILEDGVFSIKDFAGEILMQVSITE
ncbi:phosphodiesterase [Paenibacillus massiliensis]|uniref:phosphodiesterase n=1 Tax=Paenibacillus massiliensis TaxID=225917 RepID=UPI000410110F|nr:phosphodiesterase [Paenibacillus massiliensis]